MKKIKQQSEKQEVIKRTEGRKRIKGQKDQTVTENLFELFAQNLGCTGAAEVNFIFMASDARRPGDAWR